ncbi:hypothetical protein ACHAW5_003530 [Stephanodiscus triporus]|uniref:Mitochondrial import receptor subunit TOM40 n=1 Tax=Stephanodiscus triporus TaxID=2934178 RepID=A0ABD3PEH0_9STRA
MNIPSIFPLFRTRCDAPPLAPPPLPPLTGGGGETTTAAASKSSPPSPPPPPPPASSSSSSSSSSGSSAAPAAVVAPPAPPPGDVDDDIAKAASMVSSCPNPGPLEAATWDVRRLTSLDTYDGVRIDVSKQLSPYFSVVHSFHLGTSMLPDSRNSSYGFTAQMNDEEGFMMARVDPERGTVDGRIHRSVLGGAAMAKLQVGTSAEGSNDQLLGELDLSAMTWTANLKYGSMGGGNVFGCNYYQAVSPRLALGAEGMYIGANGNMLSSYTAKLSFQGSVDDGEGDAAPVPGGGPSSYLAATYNAGQGMLSVNYKRAVTPSRVNVGVALECSPITLESQVMAGAEFNLTRSKMNVCVDGTGRVQSVLETKLGREPGSPSLNFTAELDHGKSLMRFGYGLNIGS